MNYTLNPKSGIASDPAAIIAAMRLIFEPGQVTELRALDATLRGERRQGTISGFFDDAEKLAQAVGFITSAKGIYVVINPVNSALLARAVNRVRLVFKEPLTSDHDIIARRWLPIDVDPVRPADISASDAEHQAALAMARRIRDHLAADGWPDPILADSGNGGHLLYRTDLPADDGGIVEKCLEALDAQFSGDGVDVDLTVFNPARICKLYGTPACKGDSTAERPHRRARILEAPDSLCTVPRDLLEALAAQAPASTSVSAPKSSHNGDGQPFDVERWIAERVTAPVEGPEPWQRGKRWVFPVCPWNADHTNRSAFILQFPNGAWTAGCHHNGCKGRDHEALRDVFEPGWRERKTTRNASAANRSAKPAVRQRPKIETYQPFPVEALPEPICGFVNAGAKAMRCDHSFIALPLLSALAAAIGNTRRLQVKKTWHAPAIVWTAIVGESTTGKSPAIGLALRPVHTAQTRALKKYRKELAAYEATLEERQRRQRSNKGGGGDTAKPKEPIPVRFLVSDVTVEAMAIRLQDQPRGLLLTRDELAGWLESHNAYKSGGKGGDTAHWLSMFDGRELIVDRKGGSKSPIHVPYASTSITGGVQPAILRRVLGREHFDDGLAARFLFCWPPRRPKQWTEADVDRDTQRAVERIFSALYALDFDADDEGEPRPKLLTFTPAGKRAWVDFYNGHNEAAKELTGHLASAAGKLEGYTARLAIVIHCIRQAAGDLPDAAQVDERSVEAAATLTRWFGREAQRIYQALNDSEADSECRRLIEWIQVRGGKATAREVQQGHRQYSTADDAQAALQILVDAGYGCWEPVSGGPRGGRPTTLFCLQNSSTVYETPAKTEENRGFVDVDGVDVPCPNHVEGGR